MAVQKRGENPDDREGPGLAPISVTQLRRESRRTGGSDGTSCPDSRLFFGFAMLRPYDQKCNG